MLWNFGKNRSLIYSSIFNIQLFPTHRFMQQLEETLNVSLCGYFLIVLAGMCITAFSVVTVQCSRSWIFIIRNNSIVKCGAVWYGRFAPTNCLHPQGRTFQNYLLARPWQLHIAISKTEISVWNCKRNNLRSIQLVSLRFLWPCIVCKLWSERECQQHATVECLLSTLSQYVSGIIMPIFSRTRRVLLHVVCSALTSGEKVDISCNDFFVGYCVVNLDGTSCLYANVVWKWVCLGAWLVSASCVIHVLCIGNRCTDACVVPFWWEGCVVQVLLGALGGVCRWWAGWYRGWRFNVKSATYLVLLDVVGSGCGAMRCKVRAPTTSSRTRYVANFTLNLHPLYQPAHHQHTPPSAPNNTCTTHPSHQTGTTHASVHLLPIHKSWNTHEADTSPTPGHTNLHTTFAYTHEVPFIFTTQYPTKRHYS